MTLPAKRPLGREAFAGALIANAAAKPFNIALLVGTMAAATIVGGGALVALVAALAVYAIAVGWTFFDGDEADDVLVRVRGEREPAPRSGRQRVDAATLAPQVRRHLLSARAIEARIREAIGGAELPYAEVSGEVDALVSLMELSASRAQLLWEALEESPPQRVAARLHELQGSGKAELIEALEHQLAVQRKMQRQLDRFYDEMERMVVEIDSIRGSLFSASASTDADNQRRLAGDVRALRDEMGSLADGMSEAFEDGAS